VCGLVFEREEGYWVGAVVVNTAVTFAAFVLTFVTAVLVTWPEVPWGWVTGVTVAVNLVIPILFYPISKSLWLGLELSWHPPEPGELTPASD
jgi:hypothetical protein